MRMPDDQRQHFTEVLDSIKKARAKRKKQLEDSPNETVQAMNLVMDLHDEKSIKFIEDWMAEI